MENLPYIAPGPIFEPGPGWGGKLKKWIKKYILGGDCSLCRATRYVLIFGIVFLLLMAPKINEKKQPTPITENNISEIVRPGDGRIHLARRMLANYLAQNTETQLLNGQKVFIETILSEAILKEAVRAGNKVEIETDEIKKAIGKSESLTASQLQKWGKYAEIVKFE